MKVQCDVFVKSIHSDFTVLRLKTTVSLVEHVDRRDRRRLSVDADLLQPGALQPDVVLAAAAAGDHQAPHLIA